PPDIVAGIVEARVRPALEELPDFADLPSIHPFNEEQVQRIARTEPTLRDMLQQFRHLFDHLIYGGGPGAASEREMAKVRTTVIPPADLPPQVKSIVVVETPAGQALETPDSA